MSLISLCLRDISTLGVNLLNSLNSLIISRNAVGHGVEVDLDGE